MTTDILAGYIETQEACLRLVHEELCWVLSRQPLNAEACLEVERAAELVQQAVSCLEAARHRTLSI